MLGHLELLLVAPRRRALRTRPAALRRELRLIYREADRAAKIVQNLLTFSGSQRKIRRRLRIERVLSRVAGQPPSLARPRAHRPRPRPARTTPAAVIGDPLLLQQAFLNVIINAEHAIAATGDARIDRDFDEDPRRPGGHRPSATAGSGIADDVLPRIFDPFFTTKTVGQGTGLGLAITYGIVQEHGGTIHAANDGERGAVFTIELPGAEHV